MESIPVKSDRKIDTVQVALFLGVAIVIVAIGTSLGIWLAQKFS